jgi:hypothetical protein
MGYLARLALIVGAAAVFAGCRGSAPPIGAPVTSAEGGGDHIPARSPSKRGLLYAEGASQTYMYSLSDGQLVGKIAAGGNGACTDNNGNIVFTSAAIIDNDTANLEYSYGGAELIGTFVSPGQWVSLMCSIDPTTGNIAVTNWANVSSPGGYNVEVFTNPSGTPTVYWGAADTAVISCGYDDGGNLFLGALNNSGFELLELPRGGSTLVAIPLDKNFGPAEPGTVQWDGQYMTIDLPQEHTIYRISIANGNGKVIGSTRLSSDWGSTWIENGMIAAPHGRNRGKLGLWPYPKGGRAADLIKSPFKRGGALYAVVIGVNSNR